MFVRRLRVLGGAGAFALCASALVGTVSPVSVQAAPIEQITLLNINDFHGRIDTNTVKVAGTIEAQRAAAPAGSVALLSAGDNIGASLFASAIDDDQPTIDVMNALDFDASAVGNHEFDRGFTDFSSRVLTGADKANFAYLGANVLSSTTGLPVLDEYELITLTASGGTPVTVGVIGVVTQETPTLVSPAGVAGLTFGDPVAAVNRVADLLTDGSGDEADIIVAEYHDGAGAGVPDGSSLAQELAAGGQFARIVNETSAKVDAIFTGHTHKVYAWDGQVPGAAAGVTRPILQTGSYGERIGKIVLSIDIGGVGRPVTTYTAANVDRVSTADATLIGLYPKVSTVNGIVTAALANAATVGNVAIGSVTKDITTAYSGGSVASGTYVGGSRDDRAKESTLSNLVADSMVATLSDPARGSAEIGVVNPGGLRNELFRGSDTVITYAEANAVLPFVNNLNTITLTGAQFKTLLEQQWQRLPNGTVPSRPYLQLGLSSNVSYTYDASLPEGSRITSITVGGAPIDPARGYRIGTFSFLVEGGDNFHVFKAGTDRRDSGLIDRDAWIDYLTDNAPVSPSFARRSAAVTNLPTTAVPGQRLAFGVSLLDLTSLGSPVNTTAALTIGGVSIGSVPVTGGAATIDIVVPAVPSGRQNLVVTASPSGTRITIPVNVLPTLGAASPTRLFDTRAGESPDALRTVPKTQVGGSNILEVKVTDLAGLVPASGVGAVSLNVVATGSSADGFLTVYPCGVRKLVSSLNFGAGETIANAIIAPVSATGTVCFYSQAPVDLVVDVNGWFAAGSAFTPVAPDRLFDTRAGESPAAVRTVAKNRVGGTTVLEVKVTDVPGLVPATGVSAVSLNVVAANASGPGYVAVYPCGPRKLVSSLNYTAGDIVANAVIAPVSSAGTVCFASSAQVDLVVDVNGWFAIGEAFTAVGPDRLLDTRVGESPAAVLNVAKTKVSGGYVLEAKVTGLAGLTPATGVGAVSLNVVAVNVEGTGFLTVYPCGPRKLVSTLNYTPFATVTNATITPVSSTGTVCFFSQAPVDLVVDINGWFAG